MVLFTVNLRLLAQKRGTSSRLLVDFSSTSRRLLVDFLSTSCRLLVDFSSTSCRLLTEFQATSTTVEHTEKGPEAPEKANNQNDPFTVSVYSQALTTVKEPETGVT